MSLTPEQLEAAQAACSVAVTAGAGTGKTHMLTERFIFHLEEQDYSPLEIVAVTFTEKAAAELRARIRQKVAGRFTGSDNVLAELEASQISTIHALAARICRDHYDIAGISPDFTILDESEGLIWQAERFEEALEALPFRLYQQLSYSVIRSVVEAFLKDPVAAGRALSRQPEQ